MNEAPAVVAIHPVAATVPTPPSPRAHHDALLHVVLLVLSAGVLLWALLLKTDGSAVFVPFWNQPLPETCFLRRFTGLACPGCGLTRCFIAIAHGDLPAAWSFNPAGLWLFVIIAAQLPLRSYQLWRINHGRRELPLAHLGAIALLIFLVALIAQWLVRLTGYLT